MTRQAANTGASWTSARHTGASWTSARRTGASRTSARHTGASWTSARRTGASRTSARRDLSSDGAAGVPCLPAATDRAMFVPRSQQSRPGGKPMIAGLRTTPSRRRGAPVLAACAALLVLALARPADAADCWGGTARRVTVAARDVAYRGTVTLPGGRHETLIGDDGLTIQIVDAHDPDAVLFSTTVPKARFRSSATATRYDRAGTLNGRITLRNSRGQADTVEITLRAFGLVDLGAISTDAVRVVVRSGASCASSCVSSCGARADGAPLKCRKSAVYQPFADQGFGVLSAEALRKPGPRSSLCGLTIRSAGPRCDFLIDERCILPYPSSVFLDEDPTTPTGLRVHYDAESLPANASGKHIEPADWNTLDGFSPGPMILALFRDTGFPVDLAASNVAFHTSFARSLEADHPTVLLQADDGARVLHFAELDAQTNDVEKKSFIVRPGKRLDDATRYLVAIRDLVDTNGTPITARLAFRVLRDGIPDGDVALACGDACAAAIAARRPAMEDVLDRLAANGVARSDLILAWDFTTASAPALTGWMVSIRDQAAALGTPSFSVTSVNTGNPAGSGFNARIYARIEGTFQAPLFMTADAPGSRLNLIGGVPAQNGYATVPWVAHVPRVAVASQNPSAVPARASLWGHGLLGNRFQLGALSDLANGYNYVIAAVDMQGMSDADVAPGVLPGIADLSNFHFIPERLHQGFLNHLLLGRLLTDPLNGFNSHPAFQLGVGDAPVIDTDEVFYSGGSQGGIFGGAIMAIAEDFDRGFLAVPAANYSTLLHRSIDFNPFFTIMNGTYPDKLDQLLCFPLIQQLWDRAEPQGYLPHILPGTLSDPPKPHKILIHMATYDSEVSNLATEIMVRSLGIPQVVPAAQSFLGIPELAAPFDGSAFVEVNPQRGGSRCHTPGTTDAGAACTTDAQCPGAGDPASRTQCASGIPPLENLAPPFNNGAHGRTGNATTGAQIAAFLRDGGSIENSCDGPCDPQ